MNDELNRFPDDTPFIDVSISKQEADMIRLLHQRIDTMSLSSIKMFLGNVYADDNFWHGFNNLYNRIVRYEQLSGS